MVPNNIFEVLKKMNKEIYEEYCTAVEHSTGKKEEKLKLECERINGNLLKTLGISLERRDYEEGNLVEYSSKRPDALYGDVRIEYKSVGILDSKHKRDEIIEKVQKEYLERAKEPKKAIGIIFDGKTIIIIRKAGVAWRSAILVFTQNSLFEMLFLLVNLNKKKLSAEALQSDFDISKTFGKSIVKLFVKKASTTKNHKTNMLFAEWARRFSSIYKNAFEDERIRSDFKKVMKELDMEETDFEIFLFAMQTYYSLIVKLIASEAASTIASGLVGSYTNALLQSKDLKNGLESIENGGIFRDALKIENFIEGDFFSWYLEEWDSELEVHIRNLLEKMRDYNFTSFVERPEETKDLLKRFYQYIVPKKIRHDLGEFYTPDWLAQYLLEKIGYDGDPKKKILDPACGSGTFLVEIIKKIYLAQSGKGLHKLTLCRLITENVVGFDINPIAVLTARTNYLLALSPFFRKLGFEQINIPVYLTDSIVLPEEKETQHARAFRIGTTKGDFWIPFEIVREKTVDSILSDIETTLSGNSEYSEDEFREFLKNKYSISPNSLVLICETFSKIKKLNQLNENRVWTKIIKNSFAPIFNKNQFDYVVGNPPWINWEFLSQEYQESVADVNNRLGIFAFSGAEARLGHTKPDIFATFVYVSSKNYLKENGTLGFIVKPLFQNPAGKGFRRFRFNNDENKITNLSVKLVEDLTPIRPFEGAQNETALMVLKKGSKTRYPVRYTKWYKKNKEIGQNESLANVMELVTLEMNLAEPSDKSEVGSGWFIYPKKSKNSYSLMKNAFLGNFEYHIRQGVNFGTSTVYWLDILEKSGDKIKICPSEKGKKFKTTEKETVIERDLVYPVIKSRHVSKWKINGHGYSLVPQKVMNEDNESEIKTKYPLSYGYLCQHKNDLMQRKSVWFKRGPFYSVYSLREYTWAPFKVVWVRMGWKPKFVVVSNVVDNFLGKRLVLPSEVCEFIAERDKEGEFISEEEAHYICAVLNSSPIRTVLESLSQKGKSGLPKTIVAQLNLAKFDASNNSHKRLSQLSKQAHKTLLEDTKETEINNIEDEINKIILSLYAKKEKKNLARWIEESSS